MTVTWQQGVAVLVAAVALGAIASATMITRPAADRAEEAVAPAADGEPHTVLFVVLDTVRSLNLELCGYDRPNTRFLRRLAEDEQVAWTCQAYTSGAWTLPTHGSFFSGLDVPEHGVVKAGIRFPPEPTTLAEIYQERGYRTVMVSGNAALGKRSGLQRGFEAAMVTSRDRRIWGSQIKKAVKRVLKKVRPDEKLFLFVNIYDAHDPYPEIPEGVDWVPPQDELKLHAQNENPDTAFNQFTGGRMDPERASVYTERIRNGYDYGISIADKGLAAVFRALRDDGRLDRPHRYVVTSDHGEFLGEHGNLRHGCFVYEEVTRVPFLFKDSERPPPEIEAPFSATNAFFLLRDGHLPRKPLPATSVSRKRSQDRPSADMAGLWATPTDKIIWKSGDFLQFDLANDPHEQAPVALGTHPRRAELETFAGRHQALLEALPPEDEELMRELEELGYVGN